MKTFLFLALALSWTVLSLAQTPSGPLQAELMRSTTGRTLDERGLAKGTMPLKKGVIHDVADLKMGYVVLSVNGQKVVVPQNEVALSPKVEAPTATPAEGMITPTAAAAFTPGQIVLISAKYTLEGNQPRNVKNRLSKLIPVGIITAPVTILVTDGLSSAAEAQGSVRRGVVTNNGNQRVITIVQPSKNILTVEYSFNGQVRTKQALEGTELTLP